MNPGGGGGLNPTGGMNPNGSGMNPGGGGGMNPGNGGVMNPAAVGPPSPVFAPPRFSVPNMSGEMISYLGFLSVKRLIQISTVRPSTFCPFIVCIDNLLSAHSSKACLFP